MTKKVLITLFIAGFIIGCKLEEHKYMVISNGYKDTCEIEAYKWKTEIISLFSGQVGRKESGETVTIFYSNKGKSKVSNVNKIIAE